MRATKQVFNFVGYEFDLKEGKVKPTPDLNRQDSESVNLSGVSGPLTGLLTAKEKQVHLGRLHMKPIQWQGPRITGKGDTSSQVSPPWLEKSNVLPGQPLHTLKHALQIFTEASKEGWGAHLNRHTARGTWSLPESKLHINHLELKAVFLALKEVKDLCSNNIVLKAIADFLLYLFQDRKLQSDTIDGYRSAIAEKLGNSSINVSKYENLARLLDSFHRDRPKGRRGIPWNLSPVLHQLTKAPFEPLKEASLKQLTFKTVLLLALGSGKRMSEIHAWIFVPLTQLSIQEPAG